MTEPQRLAQFYDYDGLLNAIRNRVNQLAINGERFDEFAGLPRGYLSKLIGVHPIRKIAMTSMGPLFSALGIYCVIYEDPIATQRLHRRLKPRQQAFVRATYTHLTITDRQWSKIQKLGRAARWRKLSKTQRSTIMRALADRRWRSP
jgi:hypothetical protein